MARPRGPVTSCLLLDGGEDTGGLDDVGGADGAPGDGGGVLLGEDGDLVALDDKLAVADLDMALEAAVDGVVLEHVDLHKRLGAGRATGGDKAYHVVKVNEGAGGEEGC